MHEVREIETWILRLLSAPVPVPGKTRVEVSAVFRPRGTSGQAPLWSLVRVVVVEDLPFALCPGDPLFLTFPEMRQLRDG